MTKKNPLGLRVIVAAVSLIAPMLAGTLASAQTEKVLHTFGGKNNNGFQPWAGLTFDAAGNLYGTTTADHGPTAISGGGTVFKLMPVTGGGWTEQVLYSFSENGTDGYEPRSAVLLDSAGNLYGTTYAGGSGICYLNGYYATCGTVYELKPSSGGGFTEEILHDFNTPGDGVEPWGGLISDAAGNLYGTTTSGGADLYYGTVFELSPQSGGNWSETILHSFNLDGVDGWDPTSGLTFDAAGNLYGTTYAGGVNDAGTVYKLTPGVGGAWTESVLHSFANDYHDGYNPYAGVVLDAAGNVYGAATFGGPSRSSGSGIIFELSPQPGGSWTESIIHNFSTTQTGGGQPIGSLILDASGNLYGTASTGGTHYSGTVFELIPSASGGFRERLLHTFTDSGGDGSSPYGGLIFDSSGNLYGTCRDGGTHNGGTVFEITP